MSTAPAETSTAFEGAPQPPSNLKIAISLLSMAAAVVAAVFLGQHRKEFSPLTYCDDTREILAKNARQADELFEDWQGRPEDRKLEQGSRWNAFMPSYLAMVDSECDPDLVHTAVNPALFKTDEARRAWISTLLDVRMVRPDFDNPPEEVLGRAAYLDPDNPPIIVPDRLTEGDLIVVVPGDKEMPLFADVDEAFGEEMDIYVVDEGIGRQLALLYGWELLPPDETIAQYSTDLRPVFSVVRNGRSIHWVTGHAGDDITGEIILAKELLDSPLNPSEEPATPAEVSRYAVCDGHEWAGAVVNYTDRPVRVYAYTDVNRYFDEEGYPLANKRYYDLGEVQPGEAQAWRESTGEDVYAPCWVELFVSYVDGYRRPDGWTAPPVEGEPQTAEEYLVANVSDLPEQVTPKELWPSPSDVTPVED